MYVYSYGLSICVCVCFYVLCICCEGLGTDRHKSADTQSSGLEGRNEQGVEDVRTRRNGRGIKLELGHGRV